MTETYYYLWEFFTSITILALIAIYIVHDRRQAKKASEPLPAAPKTANPPVKEKNKDKSRPRKA